MPTAYRKCNKPYTVFKVVFQDAHGALLEAESGFREYWGAIAISAHLNEYTPPKVTKVVRRVVRDPVGDLYTQPASRPHGSKMIYGMVEFTVTDDKLTDVRIV